jgi:hypothetical protein
MPLLPHQKQVNFIYMNFYLLALFSGLVSAAPAPTIMSGHRTTIDVYGSEGGEYQTAAHFSVVVERKDAIYDDADNKILAARVHRVQLDFDVDRATGLPTLNNVPLPIGITRANVKARVWTGVDRKLLASGEELPQFEVGLVGVSVEVSGREIVRNGLVIRVITLVERVEQINGLDVDQIDQMEATQQVLELMPDGTVVNAASDAKTLEAAAVSKAASVDAPKSAESASNHAKFFISMTLPFWAVVSLAIFAGMLLVKAVMFAALKVRAFKASRKCNKKEYQAIDTEEVVPLMI